MTREWWDTCTKVLNFIRTNFVMQSSVCFTVVREKEETLTPHFCFLTEISLPSSWKTTRLLGQGGGYCYSVDSHDPIDYSMPGSPVLPYFLLKLIWVCSNSCPLSWWCYVTILSSAALFSSCPQSSPASGSFPVGQLFASGDQSIRVSASASIFPMNIQGRFP